MLLTLLCHLTLASGINLNLSYGNVLHVACPFAWHLYPNRFMLGLKITKKETPLTCFARLFYNQTVFQKFERSFFDQVKWS